MQREDAQLHLTNFSTKGKAKGKAKAEIHLWLDDLAHGKGILNYEVMCPNSVIGLEDSVDKKKAGQTVGCGFRPPHPGGLSQNCREDCGEGD